MLFKKEPKNFAPKFEIVSCFCEHNGEILLLQRQNWKPQGGKWGVPAGKKDEVDKTALVAIIREVQEETGIKIDEGVLDYFNKVYVRYPDFDFTYHIFHTHLKERPEVKIRDNEHGGYCWITPKKALTADLIEDLDRCIELYYRTSATDKKRKRK